MDSSLPSVLFRVDASYAIGSGHLMRCLALATALGAAGAKVSFICRDLPGNYVGWLRERGHRVCLLPAPSGPLPPGEDEYLYWLGVPMETEIGECKALLKAMPAPDWIVVDHYALDSRWESAVRPESSFLMVIDDIANRPHACQLLLDQNYYPQPEQRYSSLAAGAIALLGPAYALLRPEFHTEHLHAKRRTGEVRRLLVFMGGSDCGNVTSSILRTLTSLEKHSLEIEVIVGKANPHLPEVAQLCEQAGAQMLTQVNDMAARMARADLSIGATGVATWERAAVGLPTLAVSVADNQLDIARYADQLGILRWLGDAAQVNEEAWLAALRWACSSPEALQSQSARGMDLVDGLGTAKVVEKMIGNRGRLH
jgi:UDP-2,4-diacetamido-2,4,6-trideoxy-beta-L-altropyranose hydrolase